jgi:hypothetical protein
VKGDYKKGPYKLINRSITQHFIATCGTQDVQSRDSKSPLERLNKLDVGDFVFSKSDARIPTGGPSSVEFFKLEDVNEYLRMHASKFNSVSDVRNAFKFVGVIKNTVDPNGSTAYPRSNMNNRMLNVVVSQKASARNVFRSKILSGQKLWFVIQKTRPDKTRKRTFMQAQDCYELTPWTSCDSDYPKPCDLDFFDITPDEEHAALIYVGKALECFFSDMGGSGSRMASVAAQKGIDMKKLELFVKI